MVTRRPWIIAGVAALISGAALLAILNRPSSSPPSPSTSSSEDADEIPFAPRPVQVNDRERAHAGPRWLLARVQSNLERTAAGAPVWTGPDGSDPIEGLVDAYAAFLKGDEATLGTRLAAVEEAVKTHRKDVDASIDWLDGYFEKISSTLSTAGAPTPLERLIAAMRRVDIVLLAKVGETDIDPVTRVSMPSVFPRRGAAVNGVWLGLPCRTVAGRTADFEAAVKRLGTLAGPVLRCPIPAGRELDFAWMERLAKDPAAMAAEALAPPPDPNSIADRRRRAEQADTLPPPPPWSHEDAVAWMAESPDAAEAILKAGKHPVQKLDYALFLHAFRPASPARDAAIKRILAALQKRALAELDPPTLEVIGEPVPYDGTDESLVPSLRIASSAGVANSHAAFYGIPCDVLRARPALQEAIQPMFGGNGDNFLPRSGCAWGRGRVRGFPDEELEQFSEASEAADGDFYDSFHGTIRFSLAASLLAVRETMKLNPKELLADEAPPVMAFPYETWSYMSLENRATGLRLKAMFEATRAKIAAHYKKEGLSDEDAAKAATIGLFRAVFGAECGRGEGDGGAPRPSLRKLIVERAPIAAIEAFIAAGEHRKKEASLPFRTCAVNAGKDPLIHVAVGYPEALPILARAARAIEPAEAAELDLEVDVNRRNSFGKTPLMAAAQANQVDAARFLLTRKTGARVNADTWEDNALGPLAHDARTALMYAASRGSLSLIKLLIEAGADPHQCDTKARRAFDYLLGHGPTPPNAALSPEERAAAAKLLF